MRMPFGKFRGLDLHELPQEYLEWLTMLDDLREPLRSGVVSELQRRLRPQPDLRIVEDLIACGQRSLAKRVHPDVGGSHEAMLAVRHAADWLLEHARGLRCLS